MSPSDSITHPPSAAAHPHQTGHRCLPMAGEPTPSHVPTASASAIAELQHALLELPRSALRALPRLKRVRYGLEAHGVSALQASAEQVSKCLASVRAAAAAQTPAQSQPGACALPVGTSLPSSGPTLAAPGVAGSPAAGQSPHSARLQGLPRSSAQPSEAPPTATAN